jgi:hypothetical protein
MMAEATRRIMPTISLDPISLRAQKNDLESKNGRKRIDGQVAANSLAPSSKRCPSSVIVMESTVRSIS